MIEAYLLIQAAPGPSGRAVSRTVAKIEGVLSAEDVSGPYDVIARVEAPNLDELARGVVRRIEETEGVTRALACAVVHL